MAVKKAGYPALDVARMVAAVMVVAIHTTPFYSSWPFWDGVVTYGLFRLAVPFFFVSSGFFLAGQGKQPGFGRLKKQSWHLLKLYGLAVLLYLPLALFGGGFGGLGGFVYGLLWQGTFYHLWYFPAAILGLWLAWVLWRWLPVWTGAPVATLLYLVGLAGDNYLALLQPGPLGGFAGGLVAVFGFTRNGLFFAAPFVYVGLCLAQRPAPKPANTVGRGLAFALALAALLGEVLLLGRAVGSWQQGSLYLLLPPAVVLGFRFLLGFRGRGHEALRKTSLWVYLLHPWCIAVLRPVMRLLGQPDMMLQHSGWFFVCTTALTCLLAGLVVWLGRVLRPGVPPRALATVDLAALGQNLTAMRGVMPPGQQVMAVVKANAYGHGAVRVARALRREGVKRFAVATLAEGLALRLGCVRGQVLVFGWVPAGLAPLAWLFGLTLTVVDEAHAEALQAVWPRPRVQLKIDTGMHRLGCAPDVERIAALYQSRLRISGIYSHLATADSLLPEDVALAEAQAREYFGLVAVLRARGIAPGLTHLQSSYGVLNHPQMAGDCARLGLALYGACEAGAGKTLLQPKLRPVLRLEAQVASVRKLAAGEWAGYSRGHRCEAETTLVVLSIGYADGLPRTAKGAGVLLNGQRAKLVGVCMDTSLVDASGIENLRPGCTAVLVGAVEEENHPARLAAAAGTIPNELLCRLGTRVKRRYV